MCSSNEIDGHEDFLPTENPSLSGNTTCRSCTNRAVVVLQKKDVYCKSCFLATEIHKFRAGLGKLKAMKPQDNVLLAFSGSQSSFSLLHLLHSGVKEEHHKKLLFSVCVLYIDEGALFNVEIKKRQEIVNEIRQKIEVYGFPFFVMSLSEMFSNFPEIDDCLKVNEQFDKALVDLFENIQSISSKEDFLFVVKKKLLLNAAIQLKCNKIFTCEDGNVLAVKLLEKFSLGRGGRASFDVGFSDLRDPQCIILRPLRDFTKKEIVFYNHFNHLEPFHSPSFTTKSPCNVSIKKLTEKFVTDLHDKFPSTVYTIFRTGEKLSVSSNENDKNETCLLCEDLITRSSVKRGYSAVDASNFSANMSRKIVNDCKLKTNEACCGSCHEKVETSEIIKEADLKEFVCYGCSLIVKDLKNIDCLPKDLLRSAVERKNFKSMKDQISEFLLEDSPELEV